MIQFHDELITVSDRNDHFNESHIKIVLINGTGDEVEVWLDAEAAVNLPLMLGQGVKVIQINDDRLTDTLISVAVRSLYP